MLVFVRYLRFLGGGNYFGVPDELWALIGDDSYGQEVKLSSQPRCSFRDLLTVGCLSLAQRHDTGTRLFV